MSGYMMETDDLFMRQGKEKGCEGRL
jgi:hypothetical protein